MFCVKCAGSGKIMGNGMIYDVCEQCFGEGCFEGPSSDKTAIDKRSKAYKNAIKEIQIVNPLMSEDSAIEMFDKAYQKQV